MWSKIIDIFKKKRQHEILNLLKPGDLFFDVGAHLGEKSKPFIEKKIQTIMVEPLPSCIKQLEKNYSQNSLVKILQKGLGDKEAKAKLSINENMPTVSTLSEHWKKGRFSNLKWEKEIEIEITTLDHLINTFGEPDYIKVDVEGFELNVIKGLSKKVGIISFEITSEYLSDALKCLDYLINLGYKDFTFSIGERKKFFCNWNNSKNIINLINIEIQKDKFFWGDVYCK